MRLLTILIILIFSSTLSKAQLSDSIKVKELIIKSEKSRLTDPKEAISLSRDAYQLSIKSGIPSLEGESARILGINYSYSNQRDSAINYFFTALKIFTKNKDSIGVAKCYNNLGNIYSHYDNERAIKYYTKSLNISSKNNLNQLVAAIRLNLGGIYTKTKEYKTAFYYYIKALNTFLEIEDSKGIMLAYQNIGVNHYYLGEINEAETNLIKAYDLAKKNDYKNTISSINLTLAAINIAKHDYESAQNNINEGIAIAKQLYDEKLLYDFTLTAYELEKKQGNYKAALENLEKVHSRDSLYYKENVSNILNLHEEQQKSLEKEKEYELQLEKRQKHTIIMFFAVIVAALSIAVIAILNKSKRKAERNNIRLQKLNEEISIQKENLNEMNLKLEDIIAERTKDLINKNQKLSEYSSHLSHQIRGPVATLKGLIMLAEDELINEQEYIKQMKKCVDDIDSQIMDINIALHDASRKGLNKEV